MEKQKCIIIGPVSFLPGTKMKEKEIRERWGNVVNKGQLAELIKQMKSDFVGSKRKAFKDS